MIKSQTKSYLKKLSLFVFIIVIAVVYQNCGDVRIKSYEAAINFESLSAKGSLCPITGETMGTPVNVIFVVDMSLSNLGGATSYCEPGYGCSWTLPKAGSTPTDWDGKRFDLVKNLITSFQAQGSFKFSVIGFSDSSMFNSNTETCRSPFLTGPKAIEQVEGLRAFQLEDISAPRHTDNSNSPFNMGNTSYWSALQCINEKVKLNLLGVTDKPLTHIYFITDGKPTDPAETQGQYPGSLTNLFLDIEEEVSGFRVQPIYYSGAGADDQAQAVAILNNMISGVSPQYTTLVSDNFAAIEGQLKGQFSSTVQMTYVIRNFSAINLTALPKQTKLLSDSNMNGLDDASESTDATGIREILNNLASMDKDKDLIPDLVEVLRGSSINRADALEDSDGDNIKNLQEITRGSDILYSENVKPTPQTNLIGAELFELKDQFCGENDNLTEYGFDVKQLPLVSVKAYQDPQPDVLDFSHAQDENVIMLYYVAEPLNRRSSKILFVQLVKKKLGSSGSIRADEIKDFIRYGVME